MGTHLLLKLAYPRNHVRNNTGWVGVVSKNKTDCEVSVRIASFREWATAGGKCNLFS
jgi:hypothetical protein